MADTKVYTGKEGIQELWRRIKAEMSTDVPKYVDVPGTVTGTTLTATLTHNRYAKLTVDNTITDIVINLPAEDLPKVGWFKFEFTLPEDTVLEHVRVLDATGSECLMFAPMSWPGLVTYQGEVTDKIAKIIGYSPVLPEDNVLCTDTGASIVTGDRKKLRYRIVED